MNIVDANVLLYAVNEADERHDESREWLDGELSSDRAVGFSWISLLAFLRLSTKVGLFETPLAPTRATGVVAAWTGHPAAVIVQETQRHLEVLSALLEETGAGGNLTSDAHLGALSIEHQARVVTYDQDFGRFAGVRWSTPRELLEPGRRRRRRRGGPPSARP